MKGPNSNLYWIIPSDYWV